MRTLLFVGLMLGLVLAGAGCDSRPAGGSGSIADGDLLNWDALMPADWQPEDALKTLEAAGIDEMDDEDPRAIALMEALKAEWAKAPTVPQLDGRRLRLSGFVMPLSAGGEAMERFLLVPYLGACVHVPPPPANQTILVVMPVGEPYRGGPYDTLWVTGTIRVQTSRTDTAVAGYRLDAERVDAYKGDIEAQ
ncbi:DUF3299 domain-containing protein [Thiocystis violacea]|uniref:DUF3299 domain-containing protein n=1 Tax=Thiocystis violacea TaxID=13725 RepID=UPI001902DF3F